LKDLDPDMGALRGLAETKITLENALKKKNKNKQTNK